MSDSISCNISTQGEFLCLSRLLLVFSTVSDSSFQAYGHLKYFWRKIKNENLLFFLKIFCLACDLQKVFGKCKRWSRVHLLPMLFVSRLLQPQNSDAVGIKIFSQRLTTLPIYLSVTLFSLEITCSIFKYTVYQSALAIKNVMCKSMKIIGKF